MKMKNFVISAATIVGIIALSLLAAILSLTITGFDTWGWVLTMGVAAFLLTTLVKTATRATIVEGQTWQARFRNSRIGEYESDGDLVVPWLIQIIAVKTSLSFYDYRTVLLDNQGLKSTATLRFGYRIFAPRQFLRLLASNGSSDPATVVLEMAELFAAVLQTWTANQTLVQINENAPTVAKITKLNNQLIEEGLRSGEISKVINGHFDDEYVKVATKDQDGQTVYSYIFFQCMEVTTPLLTDLTPPTDILEDVKKVVRQRLDTASKRSEMVETKEHASFFVDVLGLDGKAATILTMLTYADPEAREAIKSIFADQNIKIDAGDGADIQSLMALWQTLKK